MSTVQEEMSIFAGRRTTAVFKFKRCPYLSYLCVGGGGAAVNGLVSFII